MNIIIPLGGLGERFKKNGYKEPKPLIEVLGKKILFYLLDNLKFQENDKIFIPYNRELENYDFENIIKNKYPYIHLKKLEYNTKGAAETIFLMTKDIIDNNLSNHLKTIIIDGDTFYTQNILKLYRHSDNNAVFYTNNYETNPVYSYILLDNDNKIIDIKEKIKISDNANTGVYAFNNINTLFKYSKYILDNNITTNNEPYMSCIIKEMIDNDEIFEGICLNNDFVHVLGTPIQVENFIKKIYLFQFDLDGTLVTTDDIYFSVWYDILKKFNIHLTNEMFNTIIQGNNDVYVVNKLLHNIDTDINEISKIKDELFNKNIDKIKIIDGAEKFLKLIKKYAHKITIVTNCNRITAINILDKIDFLKYIDEIIIGSECTKPKPYPDPYLKGCNIFNIDNNKTIIFEDSKTGILSAKSINPKCLIGIETVYNKNELFDLGVQISTPNYESIEINYDKIINFNNTQKLNIEDFIANSLKSYLQLNNIKIKNIDIIDKKIKGGYISDVIKIIIEFDNNKIINCILKLENKIQNKLTIMANTLGLYEREYYFYENISKYVDIEIPQFYSLIKDYNFNNIGILMEELNQDDYTLNLNLNNSNINISLKIIDSCAKLHTKFWNKDLKNIFPCLLKNNDNKFNPTWNNFIIERWEIFNNKWSFLINNKISNITKIIINNFSNIQNNLSNNNLTLTHGDVKSPNIFYKKINKYEYIPYFIDWQYIANGKGVQDIVFLMIESFEIDKINLFLPIFKNYYYQKLIEYGIINYSFQEYEKDFINSICYFPFFVAIWFGTTPDEDLIDKNFPFFFIQKLFNFMEISIDEKTFINYIS